MAEKIVIGAGTTLNEKIGEVAGRVWRQLRVHGPTTPSSLARSLGRTELELHQALGWLAREGKLRADMANDREMKISLAEHEMSISV